MNAHQRRVACASAAMAAHVGADPAIVERTFAAAVIHDLGAVKNAERLDLQRFDVEHTLPHCLRGAQMVAEASVLSGLGNIVLHHHDKWAGRNPGGVQATEIPVEARIIHVCDRVAVLSSPDSYILTQRGEIVERVKSLRGKAFDPDMVEAFQDLAAHESFWLDMTMPEWGLEALPDLPGLSVELPAEGIRQLAGVAAYAVDAKSRFTYRHSHGVAGTSRMLGEIMGLAAERCLLLETSGLLHDIGKLTVPDQILEKEGPLTPDEISIIRGHTYYTYWFLVDAGFDVAMAEWAAVHLERLDGRGYPFGVDDSRRDLEHRIIAVADIYTALREDRPYRPGRPGLEIEKVLWLQVKSGAIDGDVVTALLNAKPEADRRWEELTLASAARLVDEGEEQ